MLNLRIRAYQSLPGSTANPNQQTFPIEHAIQTIASKPEPATIIQHADPQYLTSQTQSIISNTPNQNLVKLTQQTGRKKLKIKKTGKPYKKQNNQSSSQQPYKVNRENQDLSSTLYMFYSAYLQYIIKDFKDPKSDIRISKWHTGFSMDSPLRLLDIWINFCRIRFLTRFSCTEVKTH